VSDDVLHGLLLRHYEVFALFYGSVGRVIEHGDARMLLARLAELRTRLRKLTDKRETLISNQAFTAANSATGPIGISAPSGHSPETASGGDNRALSPSGGANASALSPRLADGLVAQVQTEIATTQSQLNLLSRYSPAAALRYALRSALDFTLYYTDWSHISCFDGSDGKLLLSLGNN
jgi:hypothetical protein